MEFVDGPAGEEVHVTVLVGETVTVTIFGQTRTLVAGDASIFTPDTDGDGIEGLIDAVNALDLSAGNKQSLLVSVQAAQASIARGNVNAARGHLGAFINKVEALKRSGRLSAAVADALIAQTQLLY